jgi:fluoroacetyl-CoA thioesterase
MMKIGQTGAFKVRVDDTNTAEAMGSGSLSVFATPAMVAAMEAASVACVSGQLEKGMTTVGTRLSIEHIAATPIGVDVTATATLAEVDGRRLVFEVTAEDTKGVIGKGEHERFIVEEKRFLEKAEGRK